MKFFKKLSKSQKIALFAFLVLFLAFSFVKTYFPQLGLSSWQSNINRISNGKPNAAESKDLSVYFIDVGQADCILIKTSDGNVLIDAGESVTANDTCKYILGHNVSDIEYLVITHPHEDHFGGAARLLDFVEVKNVIMPEIPKALYPDDDAFDYVVDKINDKKIPVYAARKGDTYELGKAVFTVLSPSTKANNLNDLSVVLRLDYGETSFLFTGDAEKNVEKSLIRSKANLKCDVLKVAHHGSSYGTTKEFLKATKPSVAVISCGESNDYGHPAEDLLYRLKSNSVTYLRTDLNGNVIIGSDGKKLYCWYEKGQKNS